jgi:hypothetical protein
MPATRKNSSSVTLQSWANHVNHVLGSSLGRSIVLERVTWMGLVLVSQLQKHPEESQSSDHG